jgi:hypothetical protein
MYDTENPVPRGDGVRRRRPTAAFRNVAVGAGALSAGAGIGYAGYKAGKAAEHVGRAARDWRKSSPAFVSRKALFKLRRIFRMQSKLREIRLAAGDYARKYLIGEPLLARPGQTGYDPNVEREVKAALRHKHPLSEEARVRLAKERGRPVITPTGQHAITVEKQRSVAPGTKVKPYQSLKSGISTQQRGLTAIPKPTPEEEMPPPEALSKSRTKLPHRGASYEGTDVPDLWNRDIAGPGKITHMYPQRMHPHERPPLSPQEVSVKARAFRDPIAIHEARVKAGVSPDFEERIKSGLKPSLIVKRERASGHMPGSYLPKAIDVETRRQGQAVRDYLAGRLKGLRKEVIHPLRARARREAGLQPVAPLKKSEIAGIRSASEKMGDFPLAPGKPYKGPAYKPKPIHPYAIHQAHQELTAKVQAITSVHVGSAEAIRNKIHTRLQEQFSRSQHGKLLRETATRLTNETFNPNRTGMEDWEIKALADNTGTNPDWIRKQHRSFVRHTHLGTTQAGEDKIRRSLIPKLFRGGIPGAEGPPAKASYPTVKRLGKRTAIGAAIGVGAGLAGYAATKLRQKRETRFEVKIPYSQAKKLLVKSQERFYRRAARLGQLRSVAPMDPKDILSTKLGELEQVIKVKKEGQALAEGAHVTLMGKIKGLENASKGIRKARLAKEQAAGYEKGYARREREGFSEITQMKKNAVRMRTNYRRNLAISAGTGAAAGVGAGVGVGVYAGKRRDRRETQFAVPGSASKLYSKLKGLRVGKVGKQELVIGGALAGGITAADTITSATFPDPEKTRKESALAGAKRGLVYGTALAGVEPLIRIPLHRRLKLASKLKLIQFQRDKDKPSFARDVAVGGIEGGLGYLATDRLLRKFSPKTAGGKFAVAAGVGGLATGTIGYGLNRALRARRQRQNPTLMAAKLKEIQFQDWASIPSPGTGRRKLTVAQDRYRKVIREHEIQRKESNLAKSALAGAALAGAVHGKFKVPLKHALLGGAGAGVAAQAALIHRGKRTRDPYGEESIASKRIERIPYQAGALGTAAVLGHKLYKGLKFNARGRLIRFQQQFIPTDDTGVPWHVKEATRWIKHPQSRVEHAQKWIGRAGRIRRDYELPRNQQGKVIDERGRVRNPEWKKDWFKRSIYGGLAVGGLLGAKVLHGRIKASAVTAAGLMEKGIAPSQGERLSLNIASGNVTRAVKEKFRGKFPKFTEGVKKVGGFRSEMSQMKEGILKRANKAIERQTGQISSATVKRNKKGDILGVDIENPAKARENLAKIQAQEDKISREAARLQKKRERVKSTQGTRGRLEGIVKPPDEPLFRSKLGTINFEEVYVRPHTRAPRRQKFKHERKDFREGLLIGGGLGLGGLGVGGGLAYKGRQDALRRQFTQKAEARIAKRVAQELSRVKALHSKLNDIISFK